MSSAVFARWTRFFVQSPVARMGAGAEEEAAWAGAVVVAIDLFKMHSWGFLGEVPPVPVLRPRGLRELPRPFLFSSHAFPAFLLPFAWLSQPRQVSNSQLVFDFGIRPWFVHSARGLSPCN